MKSLIWDYFFPLEERGQGFHFLFPPVPPKKKKKSLDSIVLIIQKGNTLKQTFLFNNRPNNYKFKSTRNDWNKAKEL